MTGQSIVVLLLLVLAGLFAVFNPGLLAEQRTARLFGLPYEGPVVVILLLVLAGVGALLLALGALNEWGWRRRLRALRAQLAAKDQEIVQLKAIAYDRHAGGPVPASPAETRPGASG